MSVKDVKKQYLIDEATRLFLERGIAGVTMRDIARAGGVGEATVYRTFSGRGALVLACALQLQERVGEQFLSAGEGGSGLARIAAFYDVFTDTLADEPALYRFLSEFDAMCLIERPEGIGEYAENIDRIREVFLAAYRDGVADGSVRALSDPVGFYYATTHAMLSLCKKLAAERAVLPQDDRTDPVAEAALMCEVVLSYLRAQGAPSQSKGIPPRSDAADQHHETEKEGDVLQTGRFATP